MLKKSLPWLRLGENTFILFSMLSFQKSLVFFEVKIHWVAIKKDKKMLSRFANIWSRAVIKISWSTLTRFYQDLAWNAGISSSLQDYSSFARNVEIMHVLSSFDSLRSIPKKILPFLSLSYWERMISARKNSSRFEPRLPVPLYRYSLTISNFGGKPLLREKCSLLSEHKPNISQT